MLLNALEPAVPASFSVPMDLHPLSHVLDPDGPAHIHRQRADGNRRRQEVLITTSSKPIAQGALTMVRDKSLP